MYGPGVGHPATSQSMPNLRARQPLWIAIMVVFGLALVGGGIAFIVFKVREADPGADACDRIEQLAKRSEFDAGLAETVVARIVRLDETLVREDMTGAEPVKIHATGRAARCHEAMKVLDDAMRAGKYEKLVACIAKATSVPIASGCLDDVGI